MSQSSQYVWICLNNIQNMHEFLLCLKLTKYFNGSEYAWIHTNMSNCTKILNMSEYAEICPNVDKYASIYLTL